MAGLFFFCNFVPPINRYMRFIYRLLLLSMLLQAAAPVEAGVADELIFRPITASDGIADNSAQTIKCTFTGRMTITTIGSINFYDGANFSHINNEKEVKYRLDDYDGNYHLYYDNSHHLWLKNTHTVSCVNLTTETYFQNIDSIFALYGATGRVADMYVDSNGDVWLCQDGFVFSDKHAYKVPQQRGKHMQDLEVYDGRLLMLFYDDGSMVTYDVNTGKRLYMSQAYGAADVADFSESCVLLVHDGTLYLLRNGRQKSILTGYCFATRKWSEILRLDYHMNNLVFHEEMLYISSAYGYFTYTPATGELSHHEELTLSDGQRLLTDINVIEFDKQGGMWIGTERRGLLYSSPKNAPFTVLPWSDGQAQRYEQLMTDLHGISDFRGRSANVMLIDSRHWTWVGTPNGLYLYKEAQDEPVVYSRRNGLMNSVIHAIIEDVEGNIWVSTSYGISCLSIQDGNVKQVFSFTENDNVPNETFLNAKAIKLSDDRIVMKSIDHFVVFQPRDFNHLFHQPPTQMDIKLTKLYVNGIDVRVGDKVNGNVVLEKAITRAKEINLNYDQNTVSLTFSALNFSRPLQTYYRVRIKEISKQWTEYSYFSGSGLVDSKGLLHLPLIGLKPGTYHVEVMASVVPGKFVGEPYVWVVYVNQPWWRTTGPLVAFALLVIVAGILNFVLYSRNMRMKMKRNNEEGDVIRRIKAFVDRCDNFNVERLSPTQEEIYGQDKDFQGELNGEFQEVMQKIIAYVHERQGRSFTMHMLSQAVNMDVHDLYGLLLDNIHKSPRTLVLSLRLAQVAEQLRLTDTSVNNLAMEQGFVSPNYMIAKFYHKYRVTPGVYRETSRL